MLAITLTLLSATVTFTFASGLSLRPELLSPHWALDFLLLGPANVGEAGGHRSKVVIVGALEKTASSDTTELKNMEWNKLVCSSQSDGKHYVHDVLFPTFI